MALADWANGYIPIITHHFFTKHQNTFSTRGFVTIFGQTTVWNTSYVPVRDILSRPTLTPLWFPVKKFDKCQKSPKNVPLLILKHRIRENCPLVFWLHWMVYCGALARAEEKEYMNNCMICLICLIVTQVHSQYHRHFFILFWIPETISS